MNCFVEFKNFYQKAINLIMIYNSIYLPSLISYLSCVADMVKVGHIGLTLWSKKRERAKVLHFLSKWLIIEID